MTIELSDKAMGLLKEICEYRKLTESEMIEYLIKVEHAMLPRAVYY